MNFLGAYKPIFWRLAGILIIISTAEAIKCFQCNSINNSACTNLETYGNRISVYPTECAGEFNDVPFCRKTVIKIADKLKNMESRVIRSCGWIKYKLPCYNADNEDHSERVCQCFHDNCNSSHFIMPSPHIIIFTIAILLTIFTKFMNFN